MPSKKPFSKKKKIDGWYSRKKYPHFDKSLSFEEASKFVESFVKNPTHAFYPFLSYEKKNRRYKGKKNVSTKKRPIKYCAHKDGYIYSWYAKQINNLYEKRIAELGITECVIAYRAKLGNNAHFAFEAFKEIKIRENCMAIVVDISKFFDRIDHQNLKKEWQKILHLENLPKDHYKVYKSLTRWAEISRDDCYARLADKIKIFIPKDPPHPLCSDKNFREVVKGDPSLVKLNKNAGEWSAYGIPQGSPLSALLSNLYMIPFDVAMNDMAIRVGGYYRRYSDDILFICDRSFKKFVLDGLDEFLEERGSALKRNDEKTNIVYFQENANGNVVASREKRKGVVIPNSHFTYLGFTFDGERILVKSATLSRYWRRLIYGVRKAKRNARYNAIKGGPGKIRKRQLYQSFTHLGKQNFIRSYLYPSAQKSGNNKRMRRQVSGHMDRIKSELKKSKRRRIRRNKI